MLNSLSAKVNYYIFMNLGVPESAITKWEEENGPFILPDDYKAFL
jgi:hypothetical protein